MLRLLLCVLGATSGTALQLPAVAGASAARVRAPPVRLAVEMEARATSARPPLSLDPSLSLASGCLPRPPCHLSHTHTRCTTAVGEAKVAFNGKYARPVNGPQQGFVNEMLTSVTLATCQRTYKPSRVFYLGYETLCKTFLAAVDSDFEREVRQLLSSLLFSPLLSFNLSSPLTSYLLSRLRRSCTTRWRRAWASTGRS